MSFISVSPGEIFAASKSLYRLWQESKNARERHRQAREFANCARITFRALKNACNALGAAGDELRPQLDIIKRAHDDLDAHLGRFDASFAQPENTHRMRNVPRHARWVFAQLDHRVEHLQSTLTTASTMCSLAMVPYMRWVEGTTFHHRYALADLVQSPNLVNSSKNTHPSCRSRGTYNAVPGKNLRRCQSRSNYCERLLAAPDGVLLSLSHPSGTPVALNTARNHRTRIFF